MPNVVLTQPVSGSGIPGTISIDIDVPFGTTTVVDSCMCLNNMSVKWIYTLMSPTEQLVVTGEVLGQHRYGQVGSATHNVSGIIGDKNIMRHVISVDLAGGNLRLKITNNDINSNDWKATVVRIQLLS